MFILSLWLLLNGVFAYESICQARISSSWNSFSISPLSTGYPYLKIQQGVKDKGNRVWWTYEVVHGPTTAHNILQMDVVRSHATTHDREFSTPILAKGSASVLITGSSSWSSKEEVTITLNYEDSQASNKIQNCHVRAGH